MHRFISNLNPNTKVEILNISQQNHFYEILKQINLDVIIQTELISQQKIIYLNEYCRERQIKFIYGANIGLSGFIFSDFGNDHLIYDMDGEEPKRYLIKEITNEKNGKVTIEEETDNLLNLDEGDYIIFKNVKGMVELNDNKPRKIINIDDKIISIDEDTTNYHKFDGNGDIYESKLSTKMNYISFKESINLPFNKKEEEQNFTEQPERKLNENKLYLSIIMSLGEFLDKNKNLNALLKIKK